jgi:hypothetical protein
MLTVHQGKLVRYPDALDILVRYLVQRTTCAQGYAAWVSWEFANANVALEQQVTTSTVVVMHTVIN